MVRLSCEKCGRAKAGPHSNSIRRLAGISLDCGDDASMETGAAALECDVARVRLLQYPDDCLGYIFRVGRLQT
jgi:hypothetical protein